MAVLLEANDQFEKNVRPLLIAKCGACHNPKVKTGGLDLTTPEGLRSADQDVGLLHAGLLLKVISWQDKIKMPPAGQLAPSEQSTLESWIRAGAALPEIGTTNAKIETGPRRAANWQERFSHWSFQPITRPAAPKITTSSAARIRNDVDRFIFAKLDQAGIELPEEANRLTLLRRAKFDLHGLPPTPEEIQEFEADTSPDAYERLIDRLLASPRYGERWGRHWLDVARYAETGGIDENEAYREAWRYREYVIDAFNRDLPFNQFMLEQLAGDLAVPSKDRARGRIATGFLALGPKAIVEQDKTKQLYDVIDEQIDTTSKAFLGLTISCARCHDHKFDPITIEDYYSMASIFRSSRMYDQLEGRSSTIFYLPLHSDDAYEAFQKRQEEIRSKQLEIDALIEPEVTSYVYKEFHPKLASYMVAAWKLDHTPGVNPTDLAVQSRLDPGVLQKLAKYLRPGDAFRPFLSKWHTARADNVESLAAEYAEMIRDPAMRWRKILEDWARSVQESIQQDRKPDPRVRFEGFAFSQESERFFGDISFLANTFNEKDREDGAFAIPDKERIRHVSELTRKRVSALEQELAELRKTAPKKPLVTHAVAEWEPFNQRVFLRGSHTNLGKEIPKAFPAVLTRNQQPPIMTVSGRLELGRWLGSPDNPLPSRVVVNRIWLWHFGEGLVRTPDNFGLRGEAPTHSELLDHLASRFIDHGWSMKDMHRYLMSSSVYRFDSRTSKQAWDKDPSNRLWSRFKRRRISAEEMRDGWLALNGRLDLRMGSFLDPVLGGNADPRRAKTAMDEHFRRTVYLSVNRNGLASPMLLYDFADSTTATGQRGETYIAPQALYLMNNDFFHAQAAEFARVLQNLPASNDGERLEQGILRAWGRHAQPEEIQDLFAYLNRYPLNNRDAAWSSVARILLESNSYFFVD